MVQMKTLGQVLKDTRESKQITIKQVSNSIKIRESMIEALEKGDYLAFTSDMHLKSFLRSYASYLGLNEEMAMALYRRERKIQIPNGNNSNVSTNSGKVSLIVSKYITLKGIISSVALLSFILIIAFFYNQWKAFNSPPYLEIKAPSQNQVLTSDTLVIEGFTGDPGIKVVLDGNEANYTDANGNFKINAKFSEPGLKSFQLIATNQFNKKTEKKLDLVYKPVIIETKPKIRIHNKGTAASTVYIFKDSQNKANPLIINPNSSEEIIYDSKVIVNDFDKEVLELFFNNDSNPTTSIDSKDFSIIIENGRPIIKEIKNEPTPTPTKAATPTPQFIPTGITITSKPTLKPIR